MKKEDREIREYLSLFCDEKGAKKAWKELMGISLTSESRKVPTQYTKDDMPTKESEIERLAFETVSARLKADGKNRKPMNAEIIVESAIIRARYQDTTLNTVLDRTAGKVKEELSLDTNPYENIPDEMLLELKGMMDKKKQEEKDG